MKRVATILSVVVIVVSLVVIAWARHRANAGVSDEQLMTFIAERALPPLVRSAAFTCRVPNPADNLTVELSLVVGTLAHGVELVDAAVLTDGGPLPAGVECLSKALAHKRYEDPQVHFPEGREYALAISVPIPASSAAY
jgi:hypothetical protein